MILGIEWFSPSATSVPLSHARLEFEVRWACRTAAVLYVILVPGGVGGGAPRGSFLLGLGTGKFTLPFTENP